MFLEKGALLLEPGNPLTGVHWTRPFPRTNYEFEVRATRVDGSDFFCGLTFPVGEEHLSVILGGWGGSLVGISCLDGRDASDNDTKRLRSFEDGRAYRVRLAVTPSSVSVRIDGELVVDIDPRAHALSLRPEVAPSKPLGIACFATTARLQAMRWRRIR